jgi:uncharacterized metal-binding protein YceD (DUF177 family)
MSEGGGELTRMVDVGQSDGREMRVVASKAENDALARRFGLVRIDRLEATVNLVREGNVVLASCTLSAQIVQSCAVSAEDLPARIDETLSFRFVPAADHRPNEELELAAEDCDEIPYSGTRFDLGEAVAQSLALAIDPFATGPQAEAARQRAGLLGEGQTGPFAALAALKKPPA